METKENLLQLIKQKREEMMEISNIHGVASEVTLKCSQELDELIIRYQRLTRKNKFHDYDRKVKRQG